MLSTRLIIAAAVFALIMGCSPLMQGSVDTLRAAMTGPPSLTVTRDEVMARPYYQLRVDTPWGSALMSLGRVEDSNEYWVTSTGQVLVLEHGLVRRTAGFPQSLESVRFVNGLDPFVTGLHRLENGAQVERELDWMPGYQYGVLVRSRFTRGELETVEILGEPHTLLRIEEHLQAERADFSVIHRYWVDPQDGFIFVSEQQPLPGMALRITQLRPYRETGQ